MTEENDLETKNLATLLKLPVFISPGNALGTALHNRSWAGRTTRVSKAPVHYLQDLDFYTILSSVNITQ